MDNVKHVGEEKVIRGFRGETAANWQFVRPRRKWEGNIKMGCKDMMGWCGQD
jgi:hypothetical protein